MNRRTALAALAGLPQLSALSVARVAPTDVIVAECDGAFSEAAVRNILSTLEQVWPNTRIVVLTEGIKLKVMRQDGAPA